MKTFKTLIDLILEKQKSKVENITIIGIDGPTASGKTCLANSIKDTLSKNSINCWIFRLDWLLAQRKKRVDDLKSLNKSDFAFEYEAELHMNLKIAEDFLIDVTKFNQRDVTISEPKSHLTLEGLYSREDKGELTGKEEVQLEPNMVIILDGHYTLRTELDKYIDINVVLLGELEEFLKRKVDRVKNYRSPKEAEDYYWRIDIPSFKNHIARFGLNADIIIDNTDYNNPQIQNIDYLKYWLSLDNKNIYQAIDLEKTKSLSEFIFSNSKFISPIIKKQLDESVKMIESWDSKVGHYLRTNIGSIKTDLTELAQKSIDNLNSKIKNKQYSFKLVHSDLLYNVYHRILPISLSIGLYNKKTNLTEFSIITDVFQSELSLQIIWSGNFKHVVIKRELGEITNKLSSKIVDKTASLFKTFEKNDEIEVMLPTHFTVPSFITGSNYKLIFIRKEDEVISPTRALYRLLHKGGIWIQRFALFSELKFFQYILSQIGVHSVQIGYYLISIKHNNSDLNKKFDSFASSWQIPIQKQQIFDQAFKEMDQLVIDEREHKSKTVKKEFRHFNLMDGYLFSRFMYHDDVSMKEALHELKMMLLSENRLLRKRANQFILKYFPMILLPTHKLWEDIPKDFPKEISLENYNRINPSIMTEVFLWLAIRGERSAILANTIYDIRNTSLDSYAYLLCAAEKNVPVILQTSLHAAGQKETDEHGKTNFGYLKLNKGPIDFIDSVMKSARDLYLTKGILPPLFGISLDHVNAFHDKPEGRSKRFLNSSLQTGRLTHYVQDGSSYFKAESRDTESLEKSYNMMAKYSVNLVDNIKESYLVDREICTGELNYIENETQALIPTIDELRLFMRCYQNALKEKGHLALLARPTLFIGNLGTTHHSYDVVMPSVENATLWRDALKNEHFISPVLHGTTNSHRDVLEKASNGCHKINVAGDLLKVIVENLPEKISRIIHDSNVEPKKMLASVRFLLDELSYEELERIHIALVNKCNELFNAINPPRLTNMDSDYFHYNTYKYPPEHIDVIIKSVHASIEKFKGEKPEDFIKHKIPCAFSASMIEVPEEEITGKLIETLWKGGIRHFHIDAGDGEFVSRKFTGINKAKYLKKKYPDSILHAHLMISNPHFPKNGELSEIQQYANAGCDAIAIHPRAFKEKTDVMNALKLIRNFGCKPGILIETNDSIDTNLENIITNANLDWVVVMGVPVGYGGQIFQFTTLQRIRSIYELFKNHKKNFIIEVDGGLTLQTLRLCKNAGANLFSGWSIVKANDLKDISNKIKAVNKILKT